MNNGVKKNPLDVDKFKLDEEWESQPKLHREHADQLAEATRQVTQAKNRLKLRGAQLALDIRKAPSLFGLLKDKPNNDEVEAAVLLDKTYQEAQEEVIEAEYAADLRKNMVSAIIDRKHALQDLVQLFLADYFAKPKAPVEQQRKLGDRQRTAAFAGPKKRRGDTDD